MLTRLVFGKQFAVLVRPQLGTVPFFKTASASHGCWIEAGRLVKCRQPAIPHSNAGCLPGGLPLVLIDYQAQHPVIYA